MTGKKDTLVEPVPPALHDITNNSVVLQNYTELTYKVPSNTSLLNITGPVYDQDLSCYAYLVPEPWWWNDHVMPAANPYKPGYRPDQTLLLMPLDPEQEYELVVGGGGKPCAVSGVTTYSYNEYVVQK